MTAMLPNDRQSRQQGAALIIMMLLLLVSVTAILVSRLDAGKLRNRANSNTQAALAEAREALLDYATLSGDFAPGHRGRLPCPDIDGTGATLEGESHADDCGATGVTVMGRLPWRTLGLPPPKDGHSTCLWYVVSGGYKDATTTAQPLVNPDSNGQLELWGIESNTVIEGVQPADRPVAMVVAAMQPLPGQARPAAAAGQQCSSSFQASRFLDTDGGSGISNASLGGAADAVDLFAVTSGSSNAHNDRVATISRRDLERRVIDRQDFDADMRALALALGKCLADYAGNNPGGANDRRLPWPAQLALADYRPDDAYDDVAGGALSGRLVDIVDDSNASTGNAIGNVLTACNAAAVPEWTPAMATLWRNWKDHFFYAVAESFSPVAPVPSNCVSCLTVNGAGQYAAVIAFGASRLDALGQVRDAPPLDADTRDDVSNYLEATNATAFPYASGTVDFTSQPASATFNDRLVCVDASLNVAEC